MVRDLSTGCILCDHLPLLRASSRQMALLPQFVDGLSVRPPSVGEVHLLRWTCTCPCRCRPLLRAHASTRSQRPGLGEKGKMRVMKRRRGGRRGFPGWTSTVGTVLGERRRSGVVDTSCCDAHHVVCLNVWWRGLLDVRLHGSAPGAQPSAPPRHSRDPGLGFVGGPPTWTVPGDHPTPGLRKHDGHPGIHKERCSHQRAWRCAQSNKGSRAPLTADAVALYTCVPAMWPIRAERVWPWSSEDLTLHQIGS